MTCRYSARAGYDPEASGKDVFCRNNSIYMVVKNPRTGYDLQFQTVAYRFSLLLVLAFPGRSQSNYNLFYCFSLFFL